jgi:hypothetical protein
MLHQWIVDVVVDKGRRPSVAAPTSPRHRFGLPRTKETFVLQFSDNFAPALSSAACRRSCGVAAVSGDKCSKSFSAAAEEGKAGSLCSLDRLHARATTR